MNNTNNLASFLTGTINFLNNVIIPFLLAIAFLAFIWNVLQYFIIQGDSEEGQTKAKSLALCSISAFVVILSLWGIVNMIVGDLRLQKQVICPDYMSSVWGSDCKP